MAKKKDESEIVLAEEVTVRSVNEGGAELRLSDSKGQLSLVLYHKAVGKQFERGTVGRLVFIPSADATEAARVHVTVDAEDTGSLPASAKIEEQ